MKLIDILKEIGDASAGQFPFTSKTKAIQQEARKAIQDIKDTVEFNSSYFKDPNSWKGTSQPCKTIIWDVIGNRKLRYLVEIDWEVTLKSRKKGLNQFSTWARIDFDVKGNMGWVQDTNAREQYQLMATIVAIYKEFAEAVEPIAPLDGGAFYAKADSEESQAPDLNSRRARLYAQYITKNLNQLPGQWKIKANKDQQRIEIVRTKKESIKEIGDTTNVDTYTYSKTPELETYDEEVYKMEFTTESDTNYVVIISKIDRNEDNIWRMDIEFGVENESEGEFPASYDYKSVVNKGEMYKVMATVVKAVKKEIEDSTNKGQNIVTVRIEPSKNFENDSRRSNLYMAYIQKNMPKGSTVQVSKDLRQIEIDLSPSNLM